MLRCTHADTHADARGTSPHNSHLLVSRHPPPFSLPAARPPLQGFLTLPDLYTFFREVKALWVGLGEYAELDVYDVLDEVADMVSPVAPGRITMADLAASKVCGRTRMRRAAARRAC